MEREKKIKDLIDLRNALKYEFHTELISGDYFFKRTKEMDKELEELKNETKFNVEFTLIQSEGSEHHPFEMNKNETVYATSLKEAVKKAYENSTEKTFSKITSNINIIDTIEGPYSIDLHDIKVTEHYGNNQRRYWNVKIEEGKVIFS